MSPRARKSVFAVAALLLAAVAVLSGNHEQHPSRGGHLRAAPAPRVEASEAPSAVDRSPSTARPHSFEVARSVPRSRRREREPTSAPAVTPGEGQHAIAAARRFLEGYLPYSYGKASASGITAAAPGLMRTLRAAPPRVPATVAKAHPRLLWVRAQASTRDRTITAVAAVDDGQRRYKVPLEVREVDGRWTISAIAG
jgi:hypothetical protein